MTTFLRELRRRNVFRVAGVYAVVGWLLLQVSATLENAMGLPGWFDGMVVSLLLIGLPVALVLAWAFEMTPEGVKRTEAVADGASIAPQTGRTLDYVIIGGLALVVIIVAADRLWPEAADSGRPRIAAAGDSAASVAVLPFVDLSPEGDQEYFSDGISEEILNVLVRIPELKVAGRTSSFSFKGRNEDLREIGSELGVDHVLEGSVRKSGAKLRITAQLIRSSDGFHLWSETYDRELTDIFDIQDDIARQVADELAVSLGLKPGERAVASHTTDVTAYEKYLEAHGLWLQRGSANLQRARMLLTEAVALDPGFADAWAELAMVNNVWPFYDPDGSGDVTAPDNLAIFGAGEAAARRALVLDPANVEALSALAAFAGYRRNLVGAFEEYDRALAISADPALKGSMAQLLIQTGYFNEAEAAARAALADDPLNVAYVNTAGWAIAAQGRYDEALAIWHTLIDTETRATMPYPYFNAARAYLAKGDSNTAWNTVTLYFERQGLDEAGLEGALAGYDWLRAMAAGERSAEDVLRSGDVSLGFIVAVSSLVNDDGLAATALEPLWSTTTGLELQSFDVVATDHAIAFSNPVWRQGVRDSGLLALWQSRGFPEFCHAVGSDDFACEAVK